MIVPCPPKNVTSVSGFTGFNLVRYCNERLIADLAKSGSCDCSYSLEGVCRFRVNIYRQRGSLSLVLRN